MDSIVVITVLTAVSCSLAIIFYLIRLSSVSIKRMESQSRHHKLEQALETIDAVIQSNVIFKNITEVNELKKSAEFTQLDKVEVFETCRSSIVDTLNEKQFSYLYPYIEDIDEWLNDRIEYHVGMEKQKNRG